MIKTYKEALYHVKRGFFIVGLTGYTGAGCSTCKEILSSEQQPEIPSYESIAYNFDHAEESMSKNNDRGHKKGVSDRDRRIYEKLKRAWENEVKWTPFIAIEMSTIIFSFVIYRAIIGDPKNEFIDEISELIDGDKERFRNLDFLWKEEKSKDHGECNQIIELYIESNKLYKTFKSKFAEKNIDYVTLMQDWGDQIRKFGSVEPDVKKVKPGFLFRLPDAVHRLIEAYREVRFKPNKKPAHFVIDAFRNPFEVEFFKRRYSEFYLVAIMRDGEHRRNALGLGEPEFKMFEERETGEKYSKGGGENFVDWVTSQNIDQCLLKADMYIENLQDLSKVFAGLRFNLIKLITLEKCPGCIPPTKDERNMQIAMTSRQMSGCISRQVGAVVVDKSGYVLGIGWNDPPTGQTPCSLRTGKELVLGGTKTTFSDYELSETFVNHMKKNCNSMLPFCFKTEYARIEKKKKAEFTRALHAEENAFLQAARHGSEVLGESVLYTTSRTCNLCAKKAYHLGVKRIVYIEDYTDIAIEQTIRSGNRRLSVDRFQGITGAAYFHLFTSLIPEKDLNEIYTRNEFERGDLIPSNIGSSVNECADKKGEEIVAPQENVEIITDKAPEILNL